LAHARELARRHGEHATLLVPICADDHHAAALLERHQLVAQDWSILRMARSLAEPVPMPQAPVGFALRAASSQQEMAAATALYQDIFMARSSIVQDRLALSREVNNIRALDLIAVAPNGVLAAFCLCLADTHAGAQHDRGEGWIDWLGTHPAFRQRRLGRAILRASLQYLRDLGAGVALLGTASWNAAAQQLFASEGFRLLHHVRWFAWEEET
jgi:mycothiol synthase